MWFLLSTLIPLKMPDITSEAFVFAHTLDSHEFEVRKNMILLALEENGPMRKVDLVRITGLTNGKMQTILQRLTGARILGVTSINHRNKTYHIK